MSKHLTEHMMSFALPHDLLVEVEEWRRVQPDLPNRREALRRLIEKGLAVAPEPPCATP